MPYIYRSVVFDTLNCTDVEPLPDGNGVVFTGPGGAEERFLFRYAGLGDLTSLAYRARELGRENVAHLIDGQSPAHMSVCQGYGPHMDRAHETFQPLEMVPVRLRSGLVVHKWLCPKCVATVFQNSMMPVDPVPAGW